MKLVRFKDGRWGVKKWLFSCQYLDVSDSISRVDPWWYGPEYVDRYCKGTLEEAAKAMGRMMPKTPIEKLQDRLSAFEKEVKQRLDGNMNDLDALYKYLGVHGLVDTTGRVIVVKNEEDCSAAKKSKK